MQHIIQEDLLFSRHFRLPRYPELKVEFTQDPPILHQYYTLRGMNFADSPAKLRISDATESDARAQIIIVKMGRQVVGGARIIIRHSPNDTPLSIEDERLSICDALANLELKNSAYGEISKLFLLEEYQKNPIINAIYECISAKLKQLGVRYAFANCALPIMTGEKKASKPYRITIHHNFTPNLRAANLPSYQRLTILDAAPPIRMPTTKHNAAIEKLVNEIASLT